MDFYLQYPFESLFRSFQYALVDNSCHEFTFVTEFFMTRDTNALLLFEIVMGKTMTMLVVRLILFFLQGNLYCMRIGIARYVPGGTAKTGHRKISLSWFLG